MYIKDTCGTYRKATPSEILDAAQAAARQLFRRGRQLTCVADSKAAILAQIGQKESEVFACLFLDNRHRVIAFEELFQGTIDGAPVYPREIVRRAIHHNAAAIVLAHNHPTGIAEPSTADKGITARIEDAMKLIDVRVLDHIIVGSAGETYSFTESGLI